MRETFYSALNRADPKEIKSPKIGLTLLASTERTKLWYQHIIGTRLAYDKYDKYDNQSINQLIIQSIDKSILLSVFLHISLSLSRSHVTLPFYSFS